MIIYKLQQQKTNKVYVGYSVNDNPNNFGTGKYIKRAVKDFGTKAFSREVMEVFENDESLSDVLKRVEYWINKFKSDNEESLNTIIIQKSMERSTKPVAISRYVRQLIVEHIVDETKPEKQLIKNK